MLCQDVEEKWGKNKESRSLGFRRTVARDLRLRDSGGFGFIRFGPHNLCAATTFCVDIYHSFHAQSGGRRNLVAEANIYKSSHHSEGGIWSLLTMPFDTGFYVLANL